MIGDKTDKYLDGEITISHCRGHNTIIIFFISRDFLALSDYLRLENKIIYDIDTAYDVPRIEIAFDGWYVNSVPF